MKEREIQMLGFFRNNARTSLTKLSRLTKIPVSTIFDKLKEYEKSNLIRKHTCLIDFKKLGFDVKTQLLVTANKENREELQRFLITCPKVNTVFRINNGYDFLVEAIFKDMHEVDEFTKMLDKYNPKDKKEFFVMEDIKREEFMTQRENLGLAR